MEFSFIGFQLLLTKTYFICSASGNVGFKICFFKRFYKWKTLIVNNLTEFKCFSPNYGKVAHVTLNHGIHQGCSIWLTQESNHKKTGMFRSGKRAIKYTLNTTVESPGPTCDHNQRIQESWTL